MQARTRGWESVHAGGLAGPAAAAAAQPAARQAGSPAIARKLLLHVQRQLRHLQTRLVLAHSQSQSQVSSLGQIMSQEVLVTFLRAELGAVRVGYEALRVGLRDDVHPVVLLVQHVHDLKQKIV